MWLAALALAATPSLTDWGRAMDRLALTGPGVVLSDHQISLGALELTFEEGHAVPVQVGHRTVGVWLSGRGRFRYVSSEPIESATYRGNVARQSGYEVGADGAVADQVHSALVLVSGGDHTWIPDATLAGQPPAAVARAFARHLERRRRDRGWRYPQLLPQALVDPPDAPLVVAEIDAAREDLHYTIDSLRDGDAHLAAMRRPQRAAGKWLDRRYPAHLSFLPLDRDRLEPREVRFVLTALEVEVVNPAGREVRVSGRARFEACRPLRALDLRLETSVTGTVGLTGRLAELHYALDRLRDGAGRELPYSLIDEDLVVELFEPLAAGEAVELHFELSGDVLFRPGGDNYWLLGRAWFPAPAAWPMQGFRYRAVVKVPQPFVPFSNGRTLHRWSEGTLACAEFLEPGPMQGAIVLAGRYATREVSRGGRVVRVSSYAWSKPGAMQRVADQVLAAVERLEPVLGPHPFPEIDVIEINQYGFGVAPPGMIFLTREAFPPPGDELARRLQPGVEGRIGHEVAHAWFGNRGLLGDPEDQWLSESTAEHAAAWLAGGGERRLLEEARYEWQVASAHVAGPWSVYLANYVQGREGPAERQRLLYGRGPLLLDRLRGEIGDPAYAAVLAGNLGRAGGGPLFTRDFLAALAEVAGPEPAARFRRALLSSGGRRE